MSDSRLRQTVRATPRMRLEISSPIGVGPTERLPTSNCGRRARVAVQILRLRKYEGMIDDVPTATVSQVFFVTVVQIGSGQSHVTCGIGVGSRIGMCLWGRRNVLRLKGLGSIVSQSVVRVDMCHWFQSPFLLAGV